MLLPVTHIAPPYAYRCTYCAGAGQCRLACADELERAIVNEGPETVAMFIAEPVIGTSAPAVAASRAYYARIRQICDKYDVLFVADEILCGYGRCGRPFAISEWDVEPDIITLGKAIASGYAPLAGMVASEKIRQALSGGTGRFAARAHIFWHAVRLLHRPQGQRDHAQGRPVLSPRQHRPVSERTARRTSPAP
jgi:adenosylmethionine-8-amino-7-oxononanoate aminotransferase